MIGSDELIGQSAAMEHVRALIARVAPTDASVLVVGESGSGKELVARSIHEQSPRRGGPFLAVNCGALPPTLIEAELFGYEKGSFTGAMRMHHGLFERADGGTLFLDEITEMPTEMQTRLLRLVETRHFFRVGGTTEVATDVRLVAATNRSPVKAVQDGALREDLLYRLAVFPIELPPLRERGEDITILADDFLAQLNSAHGTQKRLSPEAIRNLHQHSWPGNVRELRNAIERAFILADVELDLDPLSLSQGAMTGAANGNDGLIVPIGTTLASAERALIEATLTHFRGNKRQAAMTLGCSQKTLYNKLNLYGRERLPAAVPG
jgi:DNA-binding NtrC family response regulator